MPVRPLISKIRCNNPNQKKSRIHNRNHLIYIGTREGVDLSSPEIDKQYSEDTENLMFNQCSSDDLYLKYIAERPGSNGLWGNIDTSDIKELGNELSQLTAEGKNIYRGIISLSEKDADNLGFTSRDSWENYINIVMPDIAKELGIPVTSMRYTAAFHKEKGHPHCHYMLWDSSNKMSSSYIHPSVQNRIREYLSGEMFKLERSQEIVNKTLKRDLIIDLGKEVLSTDLNKLFESKPGNIPGRFSEFELKNITQQIIKLSHSLPSHGRLNYQLLSKDAKLLVDETVNDILNINPIKKEYSSYLHAAEQISKTYSPSANHHARNMSVADQDIKKRVANQILKSCKKILSIESDFQKYIDAKTDSTDTVSNYGNLTFEEPLSFISESDIDRLEPSWNDEYKKALKLLYQDRKPTAAYTILLKQAKQNNLLAYEALAKMYSQKIIPTPSPDSAEKLYTIAFTGYKKLLEKSPSDYYYYKVGKFYERGLGTEQNFENALENYRNAPNYKYSQYALGSMYLYHKCIEDTPETLKQSANYFKLAADQGMPYAAYQYAKILETSDMSDQDVDTYYQMAFSGFEHYISSESADDFLLYRVGTMYYEGKGTSPDPDKAYQLFCESSALGNINAKYALGKTHADNNSKYYNPIEAEKFFLAAAEKKFTPAYSELGKLYANEQLPLYDPDKAYNWLAKADADNPGNANIEYQLGKFFTLPTPHYDIPNAIHYLESASSHGNALAMCRLGNIYAKKDSAFYDPQKASYWYQASLAANPSNSNTLYKIGNFYLWDKNFKDIDLGKQYLNEAYRLGNEAAKDSLNLYNNIQNQIGISTAYSLLSRAFASVSHSNNKSSIEDLLIKSHSKENRKVEAQKEKEENR